MTDEEIILSMVANPILIEIVKAQTSKNITSIIYFIIILKYFQI